MVSPISVSLTTLTVCDCALRDATSSTDVLPPPASPDVPPLASSPPIGADVDDTVFWSRVTSIAVDADHGVYWFDFHAQYFSAHSGAACCGVTAPSAAATRKNRGAVVMPALSRSDVCSANC